MCTYVLQGKHNNHFIKISPEVQNETSDRYNLISHVNIDCKGNPEMQNIVSPGAREPFYFEELLKIQLDCIFRKQSRRDHNRVCKINIFIFLHLLSQQIR